MLEDLKIEPQYPFGVIVTSETPRAISSIPTRTLHNMMR